MDLFYPSSLSKLSSVIASQSRLISHHKTTYYLFLLPTVFGVLPGHKISSAWSWASTHFSMNVLFVNFWTGVHANSTECVACSLLNLRPTLRAGLSITPNKAIRLIRGNDPLWNNGYGFTYFTVRNNSFGQATWFWLSLVLDISYIGPIAWQPRRCALFFYLGLSAHITIIGSLN